MWVGSALRADLVATHPIQRETGNRNISCGHHTHSQVTGLGPQVSGTGVQVQVRVPGKFRSRTWLPTAETQDLKMCLLRPTGQPFNYSTWSPSEPPGLSMFTPCPRANLPTCPLAVPPRSPLHFCTRPPRSCTFALRFWPPANHPVSGSPLSPCALWSTEPLGLRASRRCLPCPPANLPTCQLVLPRSEPPSLWSTKPLKYRHHSLFLCPLTA